MVPVSLACSPFRRGRASFPASTPALAWNLPHLPLTGPGHSETVFGPVPPAVGLTGGIVPHLAARKAASWRKAACIMNTPDHDTLVRAVEDARRILQEQIAGG
jgi:hypothetical protein